jgi:hypothetical protein
LILKIKNKVSFEYIKEIKMVSFVQKIRNIFNRTFKNKKVNKTAKKTSKKTALKKSLKRKAPKKQSKTVRKAPKKVQRKQTRKQNKGRKVQKGGNYASTTPVVGKGPNVFMEHTRL